MGKLSTGFIAVISADGETMIFSAGIREFVAMQLTENPHSSGMQCMLTSFASMHG